MEPTLKELIEQDKLKRANEFAEGIKELMAKYKCELVYEELKRNGHLLHGKLVIVPLDT